MTLNTIMGWLIRGAISLVFLFSYLYLLSEFCKHKEVDPKVKMVVDIATSIVGILILTLLVIAAIILVWTF